MRIPRTIYGAKNDRFGSKKERSHVTGVNKMAGWGRARGERVLYNLYNEVNREDVS